MTLPAELESSSDQALAASPPADRQVTIRRPGHGPGLVASARLLLAHRDLFLTLTRHRVRVRYKQSILGLAWAVLQPLALMLIFTLAFGRIARVPSDGVPYPLFAYSGLLIWSFVATALSNAVHSIVSHAQLITKVSFPREILPLTYVAAGLFDLCVGGTVLGALLAYYGRTVTWAVLLAIPIVALLAALVAAGGFLLSALQVRFRDVGLAVPLILYLWLFATPVAYSLDAVPDAYRFWFLLNPLTGIVESFRAAVIHGAAPDLRLLAVPLGAAALLLPLSYLAFKRFEAAMADVI